MYRFALPKRPSRWKHGAILTLALFFTLLGLAPLRGNDVELQIPVNYARVKLPARAPALISIDLPEGTYTVSPNSLGYFNSANEFVYTADEPRGLIYARSGDKVTVLELQAPVKAEAFTKDYLHRIREAVTKLNARENELLQARQNFARASARPKQLAAIPLGMNSLDLAQGFDDWLARCSEEGQGMLNQAQSALSRSAEERNELKRLHYESERADIELALRSFDLQLALARLPKPKFATVLGSGDSGRVHDQVLRELERRKKTYETRHAELEQQQRIDMQWLSGGNGLQAAANALAAGSVPVMVASSGELPQPLDVGLREDIQRARLSLSTAELGYIDEALAKVNNAIAYVNSSGVVEGTELPKVNVARSQFSVMRVSELENLAIVEPTAVHPAPASNLLLELAKVFEEPDNPREIKIDDGGNAFSLKSTPHEVGYGLLIVDRCRRIETKSAGRPDSDELLAKLGKILDKPAQYGAADNDLGYLEFIHWYSALSIGPEEKIIAGIENEAKQAPQ